MITTTGELHIGEHGFKPEDVALAALAEEFPDQDKCRELLAEVIAEAKDTVSNREPDPFDPDQVPIEVEPGEALLGAVQSLFSQYTDVLLDLHVHRDVTGRIFAWQIEREL